jgi:hypothetical protein
LGQARGIRQQEVLRAKNPPLNDVDEFMKVQGFIGGGAWLKEVRVEIRDPANRLLLEVGELRNSTVS